MKGLQIFKLTTLKRIHHHNHFMRFLIAMIFSMALAACTGPNDLGMDLLPSGDLISIGSKIDTNITAYIFRDDSARTDESTRSLLGSIVDPAFGKTTIDLACQYRLNYHPVFTPDIQIDSFYLYLYYKYIFGDTLTSQHIKIYELENSIDADKKYYSNENLKSYAGSKVLADYTFVPKRSVVMDSVYKTYDTLYQYLKIPLNYSLAQKIIAADSVTLSNNDLFLKYFKGIYIETEDVSSGGSIVALDMLSNSNIDGSAMVIYYRQTKPDTTIIDTTDFAMTISSFSARINSFKHDYSGTPFQTEINSVQKTPEKLYIQSTGGLRSKFYIPGLDSWKDSVNIAVNKAELVFKVDSLGSNPKTWNLPDQLLLTYINGKEYLPEDYSFHPSYYGGTLDTANLTYSFNITQHLQQIVNDSIDNKGFYLSAWDKNSEYRRVILNGSGVTDGVKLKIAYSKINQ